MKRLLLLILFLPLLLAAQNRLALVIGNAEYKSIGKLDAPVNDADDMVNLLKECDFEVMKVEKNISRDEMEKAINAFGSRLKKQQGVGLFYYSGHGMEESGKNYLMPINFPSSISYKHDIARQAVPLELIKNVMIAAGNGQNIILLDACRTEILIEDDTKAPRLGSSIKSGEFQDAQNVFIGYATNAGTDAIDGVQKRNSPFTEVLMRVIRSNKGTELVDIYRKVIAEVQKKYPQQHPTPEGITSEPFYFFPPLSSYELRYNEMKSECDEYFNNKNWKKAQFCYEMMQKYNPDDTYCKEKILICQNQVEADKYEEIIPVTPITNSIDLITMMKKSKKWKSLFTEKKMLCYYCRTDNCYTLRLSIELIDDNNLKIIQYNRQDDCCSDNFHIQYAEMKNNLFILTVWNGDKYFIETLAFEEENDDFSTKEGGASISYGPCCSLNDDGIKLGKSY